MHFLLSRKPRRRGNSSPSASAENGGTDATAQAAANEQRCGENESVRTLEHDDIHLLASRRRRYAMDLRPMDVPSPRMRNRRNRSVPRAPTRATANNRTRTSFATFAPRVLYSERDSIPVTTEVTSRRQRRTRTESLSEHFRRSYEVNVAAAHSGASSIESSDKSSAISGKDRAIRSVNNTISGTDSTTVSGLSSRGSRSESRRTRTSRRRPSCASTGMTGNSAVNGGGKKTRRKLPRNPDRRRRRPKDKQLKSMAEQALSSLECPICLEAYDETADRVPCTLLCGHSLCMSHLRRIKICPICRAAIPQNYNAVKKSVALCEASRVIQSMACTILPVADMG